MMGGQQHQTRYDYNSALLSSQAETATAEDDQPTIHPTDNNDNNATVSNTTAAAPIAPPVPAPTMTTEQPPQPSKQQSQVHDVVAAVDEDTIQQILRFWNHPSLQQVSPAQKQEYLEQKGITKEQLFQAWDRMVVASPPDSPFTTTTATTTASANNNLAPPFSFPTLLGTTNYDPMPHPTSNKNNNVTVNPMAPNNNAHHPQPQHSPYNANTNTNTNTNTNMNMTAPYNQQQQQQYPPDDYYPNNNNTMEPTQPQPLDEGVVVTGSQVALIATVGGFLGLMAAAAVRWLNGGDFEFFPTPSSSAAHTHNSHGDKHATTTTTRQLTLRQQQQQQQLQGSGSVMDTTVEDNENEEDQEYDNDEENSDDDEDFIPQVDHDNNKDTEEGNDDHDHDPALARYLASSSTTLLSQTNRPTTTTSSSSNIDPAITTALSSDVLRHAMTQLAVFSKTMQQHVTVQQRILQKLSSNNKNNNTNNNNNNNVNGMNVTDLSMQILRQQQQQQQNDNGKTMSSLLSNGTSNPQQQQQQQQQQQLHNNADTTTATATSCGWIAAPMYWYKLVEMQITLAAIQRDYQSLSHIMTKSSDNNTDSKESLWSSSSSSSSMEVEARLSKTLAHLEKLLNELDPSSSSSSSSKLDETTALKTVETAAAAAAEVLNDKDKETSEDTTSSVNVTTNETVEQNPTDNMLKPIPENESRSTSAGNTPDSRSAVAKDNIIIVSINHKKDSENTVTLDPENPTLLPQNNDNEVTASIPVDDSSSQSQYQQKLRKAIIDLVRNNASDPQALKQGMQVLFLYVSNLSKNPHVPRFRKVYTSNESFQKVNRLQGGRDLLYTVGFVPSKDKKVMEWPPVEAEEDTGSPKALTVQEKEALVQSYHLSETAAALAILKAIPANNNAAKGTTADTVISLLEKALEVLPCPPASTSASDKPLVEKPKDHPGANATKENGTE